MMTLSGHLCVSLHVGHARRKQAGIKLQEYLPKAQIKTNETIMEEYCPHLGDGIIKQLYYDV